MAVERLLLIDDSDIDNLVNRRIVEKNEFAKHIEVRNSVLTGINYLENTFLLNKEHLPDFIFLDIRMPVLDGFSFLRYFEKLDPFIHNKCKIAILSSSIDSEDYRRAMENRFVLNFMNKPLNGNALKELCK
jgi:CheY-like chemotaxis protein